MRVASVCSLLFVLGASTAAAACPTWCLKNSARWTAKCSWSACSGCEKCRDGTPCAPWCEKNAKAWDKKCQWKKCSECMECLDEPCLKWCKNNKAPWAKKCLMKGCCGCSSCDAGQCAILPTTAPTSAPTAAPTTSPTTTAPTAAPTTESPTTFVCPTGNICDDNRDTAVQQWFEAEATATTAFGHIESWKTSLLTNGFQFFQAWVGTNDGNPQGNGYSYYDWVADSQSPKTGSSTWKLFNADLNGWE